MLQVISFWVVYGIIILPAIVMAALVGSSIADSLVKWLCRGRWESELHSKVNNLCYKTLPDSELFEKAIFMGMLGWVAWLLICAIDFIVFIFSGNSDIPSTHEAVSAMANTLTAHASMPIVFMVIFVLALFGVRKALDGLFSVKDKLEKLK